MTPPAVVIGLVGGLLVTRIPFTAAFFSTFAVAIVIVPAYYALSERVGVPWAVRRHEGELARAHIVVRYSDRPTVGR